MRICPPLKFIPILIFNTLRRCTMRRIRALEDEARGIYCGAAGVIAPGGEGEHPRASLSVAIRTVVIDHEAGGAAVYGAGGGGLMGAVSQGALDAGGEVVGFIPTLMVEREWGRVDLTEFHEVDTMHTRKAGMAERADAFLALTRDAAEQEAA